MTDHLMNTYNRLPVSFEHGEGIYLWDSEGKQYLDALSGISVTSLGHNHPRITAAIQQQAERLLHTSNIYQIEQQKNLADALCAAASMERVFFGNSGAEANVAAIKLARLYGHSKNIDRPEVIVMEGSFHGRTMATLTASGNRKVQAGFEPLVKGFVRAPYNDVEALENISRHSPNVVAVLVEPVQGEGGVHVPAENYLNEVRRICDDHGWLMMLDEIQTGMGRTGKMFAFQHTDITPDVMTLAKGLGNGVPIGACLAKGDAATLFQPGHHGSTFGGNPLSTAAGLAVIDTLIGDQLVERAELSGTQILNNLTLALGDLESVRDIRGKGLMIGVELDRPCGELVGMALERGLLINVTADNTIRLLPPLVISDDEVEQLVNGITELINNFIANSSN